jgi:hypothetical protein
MPRSRIHEQIPQSRQSAKRFSSRWNWDSPTPYALWCSTYIYKYFVTDTISASFFLGIILRVLRVEVSVYNYITNQFHTTFAQGEEGGGTKIHSRVDFE